MKNKEKIRKILEHLHLLNFGKFLYSFHYKLRHKKCKKEYLKRSNGWNDSKLVKLKNLHNIYLGKRCFIICTGPSLYIDDVNKLKNEYTFSMNSIFKIFNQTEWRPTFYAIQDEKVYGKIKDEIEFKKIKNKLIADFICEHYKVNKNDIIFPLDIFDHHSYNMKTFETEFSSNAYNIVYDGATITYSIFQLAYYMGFREIYLLGCDCNYSEKNQHFFGGDVIKSDDNPERRMIFSYSVANKFAKENDLKIYNATRGGKLEVFDRVNLDEILSKK